MRDPDKPQQIIEAAVRVFARKGYYNSRVSDIAREAGIAAGTIYLYFPNKEELFREVVRAIVVDQLHQAAAQSGQRWTAVSEGTIESTKRRAVSWRSSAITAPASPTARWTSAATARSHVLSSPSFPASPTARYPPPSRSGQASTSRVPSPHFR